MSLYKTRARRIRFWWHLSLAFLSRYKLRIFFLFFALILITSSLVVLAKRVIKNNVVTMGYVGVYKLENIPSDILTLATGSLISQDETGKPIPSLASHWQVSEDGKTYIVFLKDNLIWHDETPVDAKDISIAITNVQITALNNKAIEFILPNPISSFPQALNKPVFKTNSFYGTGSYRITDIDNVDNQVKKISLISKNSDLPKVEIKFYPNEETALNALKIGEVKVLNAASAESLENWPNLEVLKNVDRGEIVTIFYNTKDPLLGSKDLRQSFNYAISKDGFDGEIAISPISKNSWAFNQEVKNYEYSIARAKELIAKTNYKDETIILSQAPGLELLAQNIKSDWEALGVKVEIKEEKTIPQNYQAYLVVNKLQQDPDQYSLWHSTQTSTNISKYTNVKIDKLLEDARTVSDQDQRRTLYLDFQRFLVDDAPAAFLYYPNKYQLVYKNTEKLLSKLPN